MTRPSLRAQARSAHSRWGASLGTGALVLAALAVGQAIGTVDRYEGTFEQPHEVTGRLGDPVPMRLGSLTVTDVALAPAAEGAFAGYVSHDGLFLLATFEFTSSSEDVGIYWAELRDSAGRIYDPNTRGDVTCRASPPGISVRCQVLVEAPLDALPGARLALSSNGLDQRYDSMAVVDLAITREQVAAAAEAPMLVLGQPAMVDP